MSVEAYEEVQLGENIISYHEEEHKKHKILLISQNSTDIFLVTKLLNDLGNFKVYEAGNLKAAQKVVSYLTLDLIVVDDTLPTLSGYDIIERLNKIQILKSVPKVMLLTEDYIEGNYKNARMENLDFVKKPIDHMIFKTRVNSILKNREDKFMSGSIFENMIDTKINEAKEFLKIYRSFLDIDQNILFVYDKSKNQVVESNKNFVKFFGENSLFNRVLSKTKLLNRFVPKMSDPNYLNSHHPSTWIDLIAHNSDFNFLITLKNRSKEYSFNILTNKIKLFTKEMYIIKLSTHDINLLNTNVQDKSKKHRVESYVKALQTQIQRLDDVQEKESITQNLNYLLREFNIKEPVPQKVDKKEEDEIDINLVVLNILKDRLDYIHATLNGERVTSEFKQSDEDITAKVSALALGDVIRGILDNYHELKDLSVDVNIYKLENNLKIEIITSNSEDSDDILVDKILKKVLNRDSKDGVITQIVPKHVKNALTILNADIKTYSDNGQNIFLITLNNVD